MFSAIAIAAATYVASEAADRMLDKIFGDSNCSVTEFRRALSQAVDEIELRTRRIVQGERLNDLIGDNNALLVKLENYNMSKKESWLDDAYSQAINLVEDLKVFGFSDPGYAGLAGHPYFICSANLYMVILAIISDKDSKMLPALQSSVSSSITHCYLMHQEWERWNENRFSKLQVFPPMSSGTTAMLYYTFDGKFVFTGEKVFYSKIIQSQDIPSNDNKFLRAENKRRVHIDAEYSMLHQYFIQPSLDVVAEWEKYANKISLQQFVKNIGVHMKKSEEMSRLTSRTIIGRITRPTGASGGGRGPVGG